MKLRALWGVGLCVVLLAGVGLWGQATTVPAGTPSKPDPNEAIKGIKLIEPFSDLSDLSDAQKIQIKEIHKKYREQIAQLEVKEKHEEMALLSDAQKKEIEEIEANKKAATHHATTATAATTSQP